MNPTNKEYKIRKLNDLFKIPADRRRICLDEIATGLERIEEIVVPLREKLPAWLRWLVKPKLSHFTWIDDGRRDETIQLGGNIIHKASRS